MPSSVTRPATSPDNPFAGKRYSHPRFRGVALRVVGYVQRWEPETSIIVDDDGTEHESETEEGEFVDDIESGRVRAVMVGDDHENKVDLADLTEIDESTFCPECGQIGCGWH